MIPKGRKIDQVARVAYRQIAITRRLGALPERAIWFSPMGSGEEW